MAEVSYNVDQLVRDVRICLDENDVQNSILADDSNTLQLDDIIKSKIGDAIDGIMTTAPLELVGDGEDMPVSDIKWEGGNSADDGELRMCKVAKPEDYLRLVGAKMADWDYAVSETIPMNSDEYKQQKSRFAGLRGNPQRPVVAEVVSKDGNYLELYTSKSREVDFIKYIQRQSGKSDGAGVKLPSSALYRVLVYQIAGLTCITLKDSEHAQTLFGIAEGLLAASEKTEEAETKA